MEEHIVKLSVYGMLLNEKGEILLQKRANTRYANGWWSLPGGHVEVNESILKAIVRELEEECGIQVNLDSCSVKLTLVRKPENGSRYLNFFCSIGDWMGEPTISDGKASELKYFSKTDLPHQTLPHIIEGLEQIEKSKQFYESNG